MLTLVAFLFPMISQILADIYSSFFLLFSPSISYPTSIITVLESSRSSRSLFNFLGYPQLELQFYQDKKMVTSKISSPQNSYILQCPSQSLVYQDKIYLIPALSIWRCPRQFMDTLVLEDGASGHQVVVLAEVDKTASIVVDVTISLCLHHPFFSFVVRTNFCIEISSY